MDFAGLGDYGAAALCADGTLRTTQDNGRTWRDLKGGSAGLALGADEQTYAVAMQLERCEGIAVVVLDPDARSVDRDAVRCAPLKREAGEELAVGVRGEAGLALAWRSGGGFDRPWSKLEATSRRLIKRLAPFR